MTTATIPIAQQRKIRAAMIKAGVTNVMIAEQERVSVTYVSYTITGRRTGYRIREAIAEAVGRRVHDLWPDHPRTRRAA